ncbi:1520401A03Rik [Phodopus roborovskii]|uniref:1520401A03Rik protein n=1 Tax=Phodopus roborovskii TaxID=109678 RepID=A0AAU9Z434_PHORO|nr:1520401A03Rik [Phodopus roborovskii]
MKGSPSPPHPFGGKKSVSKQRGPGRGARSWSRMESSPAPNGYRPGVGGGMELPRPAPAPQNGHGPGIRGDMKAPKPEFGNGNGIGAGAFPGVGAQPGLGAYMKTQKPGFGNGNSLGAQQGLGDGNGLGAGAFPGVGVQPGLGEGLGPQKPDFGGVKPQKPGFGNGNGLGLGVQPGDGGVLGVCERVIYVPTAHLPRSGFGGQGQLMRRRAGKVLRNPGFSHGMKWGLTMYGLLALIHPSLPHRSPSSEWPQTR